MIVSEACCFVILVISCYIVAMFIRYLLYYFVVINAATASFVSNRIYDPIVLKGAELPELIGQPIDFIVGFVYNSDSIWKQIPIQINEKHWQDWVIIKNGDCRL